MVRVAVGISGLDAVRPRGSAAYAAWLMAALSTQAGLDLVEERSPADAVLSLDGRVRSAGGRPVVTLVDNLEHVYARDLFGGGRWLRRNWQVARAARQCTAVLAPSEAIRGGLERYRLRRPADVAVVAPLPGAAFRRRPAAEVEALRARLGLPPRYLLVFGSLRPARQLDLVARAWRAALPGLDPETGLVVAGEGDPGPPPGTPRTTRLGWVGGDDVPALLSGAVAWLCAGRHEGSALGALEAMACGAPPLVAGAGALPRAVEGAGLVFDPTRPDQLAEAMVAVSGTPQLRSELSLGSLKRVAELRAAGPRLEPLLRALSGRTPAGS